MASHQFILDRETVDDITDLLAEDDNPDGDYRVNFEIDDDIEIDDSVVQQFRKNWNRTHAPKISAPTGRRILSRYDMSGVRSQFIGLLADIVVAAAAEQCGFTVNEGSIIIFGTMMKTKIQKMVNLVMAKIVRDEKPAQSYNVTLKKLDENDLLSVEQRPIIYDYMFQKGIRFKKLELIPETGLFL